MRLSLGFSTRFDRRKGAYFERGEWEEQAPLEPNPTTANFGGSFTEPPSVLQWEAKDRSVL